VNSSTSTEDRDAASAGPASSNRAITAAVRIVQDLRRVPETVNHNKR
jgi:hypothetical protein